jgi:hypothetical protein
MRLIADGDGFEHEPELHMLSFDLRRSATVRFSPSIASWASRRPRVPFPDSRTDVARLILSRIDAMLRIMPGGMKRVRRAMSISFSDARPVDS